MKTSLFRICATCLTLSASPIASRAQSAAVDQIQFDAASKQVDVAYRQTQLSLPLSQHILLFSIKNRDDYRAVRAMIESDDNETIPLLVQLLEVNPNWAALSSRLDQAPLEIVKRAIATRLQNPAPVILGRQQFVKYGASTPTEVAALNSDLDKRLRTALIAETAPKRRAFYALRGLLDSEGLRQDPLFWHEFLIHFSELEGYQYPIAVLIDTPSWEISPRITKYPIQLADLKTALESGFASVTNQKFSYENHLDSIASNFYLGHPAFDILLHLVQERAPAWTAEFLRTHETAKPAPN